MVDALPTELTRDLLSEFIPNPRTIRAFENLNQNTEDSSTTISEIQSAPLIALSTSTVFSNDRFLNPGTDVTFAAGGPKGPVTFGLTDTGVGAATYGSATQIAQFSVDAKGRLTLASNVTLNSDNVVEGAVNLYFTDARARAALSGGTGIAYTSGTGVIALDTASPRNVDHSAVSITAGDGLTGGGDISASRTLNVGAGTGIAVGADTVGLTDTGVVAGTYSPVNSITVDAQGRIVAIS